MLKVILLVLFLCLSVNAYAKECDNVYYSMFLKCIEVGKHSQNLLRDPSMYSKQQREEILKQAKICEPIVDNTDKFDACLKRFVKFRKEMENKWEPSH